MRDPARLLWLDASAAAAAGLGVLVLGPWLSELYQLPHRLLVFMAAVNLLYAGYSSSLARRRERSAARVGVLVAGNLAWAGVCLGMAWRFAGEASEFAMLHLIGEALVVGGLAAWEYRWRDRLVRQPHRIRPAATARTP